MRCFWCLPFFECLENDFRAANTDVQGFEKPIFSGVASKPKMPGATTIAGTGSKLKMTRLQMHDDCYLNVTGR